MMTKRFKVRKLFPARPGGYRRHYGALAGWLARDMLKRYRGPAGAIAGASVAAAVCQVGAWGLLATLVRSLEAGEPWTGFGLSLDPRSIGPFTGLLGLSALLLAGYTLLIYAARQAAIRISRRYEDLCLKRACAVLSHLPHPDCPDANRLLEEQRLTPGAGNESRICGRLLAILLSGSAPALLLLVYGVLMLWMQPPLTIGLFLLILAGGAAQFVFNAATSKATRRFEASSLAASRERAARTEAFDGLALPIEQADELLESLFAEGAQRETVEAHHARFETIEKSRLANNMMNATVLVLGLGLGSWGVLSTWWSWSELVAYIVALRFFLVNLRQWGNILASVSRFYPLVQRYMTLARAADNVETVGLEDWRSRSGSAFEQAAGRAKRAVAEAGPDETDDGSI
ncbi:MAG: hypothetical protein AAF492_00255 [Verrucomicrobiota bacterium]